MDETGHAALRRFRGHHLICLRHYTGNGYEAAFRDRLAEMRAVLACGTGEVADGPDDLCIVCPDYSLDRHECAYPRCDEVCVRALDALACGLLDVRPGQTFMAEQLEGPAEACIPDWIAGACSVCDWQRTCRMPA